MERCHLQLGYFTNVFFCVCLVKWWQLCPSIAFSVWGSWGFPVFQLSVQLNPGYHSPPGGDLLHVRAVGENDTLHYLFCSQGAPTLLLVHTNTSSSTLKVGLSGQFKLACPVLLAHSDCGEFVFMRSQSYSASHSWTSVLVCISQVNWTQFLDRNVSGGLEVEPKSSVLYSTAIIFSKVRKTSAFS